MHIPMRRLVSRALPFLLAWNSVQGHPAANLTNSLNRCLEKSVNNEDALAQFSFEPGFYDRDVRPYNLNFNYTPVAILYPRSAKQVSAAVSCAAKHGSKVQARGGGHDLTNKEALGHADGIVVVDLRKMKTVKLDPTSGIAFVGGGATLSDISRALHSQGRRQMPHGASSSVGIGGHATIGGLGMHSRLYGAALDVWREAEVVLANGTIIRASESKNSDVFWALRGAGASFGIVTEFTLQTYPEPQEVVNFQFALTSKNSSELADFFMIGQEIMRGDKLLDRRFSTTAVIQKDILTFSGAFFGPADDYLELNLKQRLAGAQEVTEKFNLTWTEHLERLFEATKALFPHQEYFDSLGTAIDFATLPTNATIDRVFQHLQTQDPGSDKWFGLLDYYGGALRDVETSATAFPHRDLAYLFAVYVVTPQPTTRKTTEYVDRAILEIQAYKPERYLNYAGYGNLRVPTPQQTYWGPNLPRLEKIKSLVDGKDTFSTPDGVKPSGLL
ncbi:FAD binding domain-containing protein [Fusarium oxysporum f. sp. phaseoli]